MPSWIANPDPDKVQGPTGSGSEFSTLPVTCVPAPVSHATAEVAAIQRFEEGVLLLPPGEPGPLQHLRQLVRLRPREHHPERSTANEKDLKLSSVGDPDPHLFGPPGSGTGSIGQRQGRTQGGCTGCTCIPPPPPVHPPPSMCIHVHMKKDEAVGNKKKMQVCLPKHNYKLDNNLLTIEPRAGS